MVYNVRTLPATAEVLEGMDPGVLDEAAADLEANFAEQINAKIDNATATIYWTDLPEDGYNSDFFYTSQDEVTKNYKDSIENA